MNRTDFSALSKVSSATAAITCIMVANFGFLAAAFAFRDKFMIFEFYLAVCFVEVVMMVVCDRLLNSLNLKSLAEQQGKQLELMTSLTEERRKLLDKHKEVSDNKRER